MAYVTTNPPAKIGFGGLDGSLPSVWFYSSADAATTVRVSGYITDGGARGMKVGDYVFVLVTGTSVTTLHTVVTVSATSPGAVDLTDGTTVCSGTNTD